MKHDEPTYLCGNCLTQMIQMGGKMICPKCADKNDNINHPSHYADKQIEVIDYIKDTLTPEQYQGYLLGNALKYISRAGKKDPAKYTEDLRKCVWYLEREIKRSEGETERG